MKIVFLVRSMATGGTQRQLVVLCRGLLRRGHEVTVLLHHTGEPLDTELQQSGAHVLDLKKRGRWHNFGFLARLIRAVRAARPDVVYAYLQLPNLLALLLRHVGGGCAVVCGVRASDMTEARGDWLLSLTLQLERRLVLHADMVVVNSQAGALHLCRGKRFEHVVVIENGIEAERFHYDECGRRRKRASWGTTDDTPVVGCVARLDRMKDHATLLQAFALLRRSISDARLICIGTQIQPYFSELLEMARRLHLHDVVRWVEYEWELGPLYSGFDVLCLSSSYGEGFSNVLAEAMSCGVPCVATDVGDASRILSSADFLVPPRDPQALARALADALAQGRTFSELRAAKIRREFSVASLTDKTEVALTAAVRRKNLRAARQSVRGSVE